MELFKSRYKLTVEYVVTYQEKRLYFKIFDNSKLLASFDYTLTGNKDLELISNLYNQTITSNGLKKFDSCDLIISSFDTTVSNMRIKQNSVLFSSNKLIKNFLLDNYGHDYENRYYINSHKVNIGNGYVLYSFFGCLSSRKKEAESLLSGLGIKNFRPTFIGQHINEFIKNKRDIKDSYLVYDHELFTVLSCVKNNQVVSSMVICKNFKIGNQISQLTQKDYILIALDNKFKKDDFDFDDLYILGNQSVAKDFEGLGLNTKFLDEIKHEEIISKPVNVKLEQYSKEEKPTNKKKGFDWKKFLGIKKKKGFTLIESAVSIAIFAIVATLTSTFIVTMTNSNNNAKRTVLADFYANNVSESFSNDPLEANIRSITQYEGSDLVGNNHSYYLNDKMDFNKPSISPEEMEYQVHFRYEVLVNDGTEAGIAQPFTNYVFTILSIHAIDGSKTYLDTTYFTVVR